MRTPVLRRVAASAAAAVVLPSLLIACSDDESDDEGDTTTTAATDETTETTASVDDTTETTASVDDTTTTTAGEEASGEIGTTELLEFLNAEDPTIGAYFDWNTGEGVIGVTYLGVQDVGLYAVDIDADTALAACELASEYVFGLDETATIGVYTGGYDASTEVVAREGVDGTCAAV